ncbi:MAG: HU family DNA-binding protein [Pseudomonadota bacterium]
MTSQRKKRNPTEILLTMALTKKDIVEQIHAKTGLPRQILAEMTKAVFDAIKKEILAGNSVKVANFGALRLRKKRARPGRNMRTGEVVEISPRSVVSFKASTNLRTILNGRKERL